MIMKNTIKSVTFQGKKGEDNKACKIETSALW